MNENQLTTGDVKRTLIRFALPFLGALLLQQLYGIVDLLIVGRFGGADASAAVSAVSTGSQLMMTLTGVISGFAAGGTVLIGQYMGGNRDDDVRAAIGTMFSVFTVLALAGTLMFTLGTNLLVSLMQVPAEAVFAARQYVLICSCGLLFITGYNTICGMLRGMGDSKRPMIFVAVACAINILGDLLLVGVFHMGAAGAAIATVFSQAVSMLLALMYLLRGQYARYFTGRWFRPYREKVRLLFKVGTPVAAQDFLVGLSFLIILAIVNSLGLDESAAVGVVERIIAISMLVPIAFMSAISVMTAQNVGASLPGRAAEAARAGLLYSAIIGAAVLILVQLFSGAFIRLFIETPAVVRHGVLYLRSYGCDILLVCPVFCLNGFFTGYGRTRFTMANSLVATFAVRIPVVWLMSTLPDVTLLEIGLAAPIASVVQILIQLAYLKWANWRRLEIV